MSTSVKFFHSGMPGALGVTTSTTLSASQGLQRIFNQCLVTGFNQLTATSLSVTSGVASLGLPGGHGYEEDVVLLISGATPSNLNGQKRVLSVAANSVTFAAAGVPDGAATGTITSILAPAGWEEIGTGLDNMLGGRIFRSLDPTATGRYFRIGGNGSSISLTSIVGRESESSGWGSQVMPYYAAPSSGQVNGPWLLIADSKTVYFVIGTVSINGTSNGGSCIGFGDFKSFAPTDGYNAFVGGTNTASATTTITGVLAENPLGYCALTTAASPMYLNRSVSGAPGAVQALLSAESYWGGTAGMSGAVANPAAPAYPNGPNNSLLLSRFLITETAGVRGHLRGFYATPHNIHTSFTQQQRIVGQGSFAGRRLMAIKTGPNSTTTSFGLAFIDITGPWE
jgi:hypothetical protein